MSTVKYSGNAVVKLTPMIVLSNNDRSWKVKHFVRVCFCRVVYVSTTETVEKPNPIAWFCLLNQYNAYTIIEKYV